MRVLWKEVTKQKQSKNIKQNKKKMTTKQDSTSIKKQKRKHFSREKIIFMHLHLLPFLQHLN